MFAGMAGGLLVFTGIWHATEWMMDGRRPDTWRLVPFGIVYLVLGCLLVLGTGGIITQIIALLIAGAGGTIAYLNRNTLNVRKWVLWVFILVDILVVLALLAALLS